MAAMPVRIAVLRVAELVGAFAASHAPLIARDWEVFPDALRARMTANYRAVGDRIRAARPDVIVEISPDHWINFFLDNLPAICIGVGARHAGPPEPFLAAFPHREIDGHPAFASHLVQTALDSGFEPSLSHRLTLDHGFCIPLWKMALDPLPPIVPIILNDLEPPMMPIARCLAWGALLAQAIASYPGDLRVAVLASGGLSHSIGEATMGHIDAAFDELCVRVFRAGDAARVAAELQPALARTGNGGHEVRNWAVAHAAAGCRGFELIDYLPVNEVYVGCAWASWNVDGTLQPAHRGEARERTADAEVAVV